MEEEPMYERKCRTWCLMVGMGVLLLVQLHAWPQQPKSGGTLRVAWEADVTGLDPAISPGLQAFYLKGNLFNTLVTVDANLNVVPELAESWDVREDGKVYVFHLRQGVKFHDGTDFDAEAVRWNMQFIRDPENKSFMRPFLDIIEAVEAIDAQTVKLTLNHPSFTLLPTLAQYREGVLIKSPAAYKSWDKSAAHLHPVGTGPFKLASWEPQQLIVLDKNEGYWKEGLPYLDRIEFKIMRDGVTRAAALRAGEVDFVSVLPREHAERLAKDPKIRIFTGEATAMVHIPFNVSRKPFDDPRVRIALAGYGLDRAAIAKTALLGYGGPLWTFLPPGSKGHKEFAELYPYHPSRAKALLKEAGFDQRNPLRYTIMTHAGEPALPMIATIMKTQLAKIGVEATVQVVDRPIFLQRMLKTKEFEQLVNASSHLLDAYDRASSLDRHAGVNIPNHQDPRIDELLNRLSQAGTEAEYLKVGEELQEYLTTQMIYMSVASLPSVEAVQESVKGYVFLRGFKKRFETTWLERP
jgi:peptide/nickel transport system substrate-binding protein